MKRSKWLSRFCLNKYQQFKNILQIWLHTFFVKIKAVGRNVWSSLNYGFRSMRSQAKRGVAWLGDVLCQGSSELLVYVLDIVRHAGKLFLRIGGKFRDLYQIIFLQILITLLQVPVLILQAGTNWGKKVWQWKKALLANSYRHCIEFGHQWIILLQKIGQSGSQICQVLFRACRQSCRLSSFCASQCKQKLTSKLQETSAAVGHEAELIQSACQQKCSEAWWHYCQIKYFLKAGCAQKLSENIRVRQFFVYLKNYIRVLLHPRWLLILPGAAYEFSKKLMVIGVNKICTIERSFNYKLRQGFTYLQTKLQIFCAFIKHYLFLGFSWGKNTYQSFRIKFVGESRKKSYSDLPPDVKQPVEQDLPDLKTDFVRQDLRNEEQKQCSHPSDSVKSNIIDGWKKNCQSALKTCKKNSQNFCWQVFEQLLTWQTQMFKKLKNSFVGLGLILERFHQRLEGVARLIAKGIYFIVHVLANRLRNLSASCGNGMQAFAACCSQAQVLFGRAIRRLSVWHMIILFNSLLLLFLLSHRYVGFNYTSVFDSTFIPGEPVENRLAAHVNVGLQVLSLSTINQEQVVHCTLSFLYDLGFVGSDVINDFCFEGAQILESQLMDSTLMAPEKICLKYKVKLKFDYIPDREFLTLLLYNLNAQPEELIYHLSADNFQVAQGIRSNLDRLEKETQTGTVCLLHSSQAYYPAVLAKVRYAKILGWHKYSGLVYAFWLAVFCLAAPFLGAYLPITLHILFWGIFWSFIYLMLW